MQERIVAAAAVGSDDVVVEIGAGLGALTRRLVAHAGQVIAIEHDGELAALLEQELGPSPGLRIERADALDFDFAADSAKRRAGRWWWWGTCPTRSRRRCFLPSPTLRQEAR